MATAPNATDSLDDLAAALAGPLLRPDDAGYDDARAVWNGMIDRYPAAIARCQGKADVMDAVDAARAAGLPATVRGGGHNVAGTAVADDALVIDCSEMTAVAVDPEERIVRVQGGATWADVDRATQQHGLATPGGVVSDTGVAGLTLGGGIGHLRCKHGLSCDNLRSVELVTGAGDHITASEDEHPELFWAIRGGGGAPGVVTEFAFDCHPVGPEVATCLAFYDAADIETILAGYREWVAASPDEASTLTFSGTMPDEELFDAEDLETEKIAIMGCYAGNPEDGERVLAPLRGLDSGTSELIAEGVEPIAESVEPIADFSGAMPYAEFQQLFDEDYPDGLRYYWKSLYLDGLSDTAIDRIAYWADVAPSPLSTVDVWELGGAIEGVDPEESAFPGRHAPFLLGVEANWEDSDADDANVAWVRDCLDDMRQFSGGGTYLNFPGFFEDEGEMVETTFGPEAERLAAVGERYDPDGIFGSFTGR